MKKHSVFAITACVAVLCLTMLISGCSSKAFSVNDVASDPTAFKGAITITGIMGGISVQDKTVFGIMDIKELQCKTQNCNRVLIPVRSQGKMPVLGDEVRATGSFVKLPDGYLFEATEVKVVRNHKIGG
jgi:hypothetical protein